MFLSYLITIWFYAEFFRLIESISVCDDVDISFFIDSEWIINGDNNEIIEFITRIIDDGSAENAGFNAIIYGDNIPHNQKVQIFDIDETATIQQREKEIEIAEDRLYNAFENIKDSLSKVNKGSKSITLNEAFKIGLKSKKNKPIRHHRKKQLLSKHVQNDKANQNTKFSVHDDENVIFIFNFDSTFGDDICDIIDNVEEDLHFIFGESFNDLDTQINCTNQADTLISFTLLDNDLLNDSTKMEELYAITCPAEIISSDGYINLGNHVQWIDENTIIECNLDNELSKYILIKDYINDDNTFKNNNYLIADIMTFNALPEGCYSSVYKIIDIITENKQEKQDDDYNKYIIRKLIIRFPHTPQEYILETKTSGVHKKMYAKNDHKRRLSIDTIELSGERNIVSLSFGESTEITKSKSFEGKKDLWLDATAEFSGEVEMTLDTGFSFDIDIDLDYTFSWSILSGNIHIDFAIIGSWEIAAWFNLGIKGNVEVELNNLLDYDYLFTFQVGIVPVLIKPFINIGGKLEVVPIEIDAGIQCSYGESYKIGYYYDKKNYYKGPYATFRNNYKYNTNDLSKKMHKYGVDSLNECIGISYKNGGCEWVDYKEAYGSFGDEIDGYYLTAGQELYVGDKLWSQNRKYYAVLQDDGNFVVDMSCDTSNNIPGGNYVCKMAKTLFKMTGKFSSGTNDGSRFKVQPDGNLVIYTASGSPTWSSGTREGSECCFEYKLILENDGNLVLYDAFGDMKWASWFTQDTRSQCRCFSGPNYGFISADSNWDSYVLDVKCGGLVNECCGCGFKFWIAKKESHSGSCGLIEDVETTCDLWECRECPIWTHFSGEWSTDVTEYDIFERNVDSNSCSTSLSTGDEDNSETLCPALELGFDATLSVQIGAYFYDIIKTYIQADLIFPLRINLPQLDGTVCGYSSNQDMCDLTWLRASITYELLLDIFVGFEITIEEFVECVQDLIDGASMVIDTSLMEFESDPIFSATIIPETSECIRLNTNNGLSFLNTIFKQLCC